MIKTSDTNRSIILTTIFCCVYLLLSIFYHHIDKHLTGVLYISLTLLMPALFITIVIYEVKGIIGITRNRKNLSLRFCLPTIICSLTLIYTIFSPYRLDSESLESEVEFRACYEGTQNQAYIKFRKDKTFELNWTGVFFANTWWTGKWSKNNDTIILKYDNEIVKKLGNKILIKDGYLHPIGHSMDSAEFYRPMFYLGFCKHEN